MCLGSVSMAICLGAPREHPQGMGLGAGWAAGLDTEQGWCCCALVNGKCGERAGTWTPTSILYFNPASKLLLSPLFFGAGGIYSPVLIPAALSSLCHLSVEELFQPVNPKIKEQTLLPAHDWTDQPGRSMRTLEWAPKQLRGFPTVISHVHPRQNLDGR